MDQQPPEFWQGIEAFNQRQFYTCHDTLEALWMEAMEPDKTFYQGILQVAVALHHLSNGNWRGAVILLGEGIRRLTRYPLQYAGIELGQFLEETAHLLQVLQQAGPDRSDRLQQQLGLGAAATETGIEDTGQPVQLPTIRQSSCQGQN